MKIACLCPTYGRPELLASSIAQFHAQTHPEKRLFILDDGGQYKSFYSRFTDVTVDLLSLKDRFRSLPSKYETLTQMAADWKPDAVAMWDDDDIYLPHHLSSIAARLSGEYQWTAPVVVWSTYPGKPVIEDAVGRFWASSAIKWQAFLDVGGVPMTLRADFDQMFLGNCQKKYGPAVSLASSPEDATFVFRWADTLAPHAQHFLRSPDDTTWYDRMRQSNLPYVGDIVPKLDPNAELTLMQIASHLAGRRFAQALNSSAISTLTKGSSQ